MLKRLAFLGLACTLLISAELGAQTPVWELYKHNLTPTYEQLIAFYKETAEAHPQAQLLEYGQTDCGEPLHLLVLDRDADFNPRQIAEDKAVVLINNAIHPGEPCGVDASILLVRMLLNLDMLPPNTVICIVPMYNIGGGLNRGCCSRANQDGPEMHGFRGNARNLDLNRDFVKMDSRNAHAFVELFQAWDPDVFIDTHTSNGADYQHVMTLLPTQPDKLGAPLGGFLRNEMLPALYQQMEAAGFPMCPYVDTMDKTPDNGIRAFNDKPRYSSGYAALFGSLGFTTEAHMLKPYNERVLATMSFLHSAVNFTAKNAQKIKSLRADWRAAQQRADSFQLAWQLDTSRFSEVPFSGYTARYKPSEVTGKPRLWYDRAAPWQRTIRYYEYLQPTAEVAKPVAYLIPQAWHEIADNLRQNGVEVRTLTKDAAVQVQAYYIDGFDTGEQPYEGHYLHHSVVTRTETQSLPFRKGDFVVYMNQPRNLFIASVLEPTAPDSYFAWNYFDAVLQQKEWFSPYVFEDDAAALLASNPELKAEFDEKMQDEAFANDPWAPLVFLYRHSQLYEATHNRYPVVRVVGEVELE